MSFLKAKILDRLYAGVNRFFKVSLFARQVHNLVQFHSGGDDYNPPSVAEGLGGSIGDNPANGFVFAWRDGIERKSAPGEKRIYAVNPTNNTVAGEVYLKNDGVIEITGGADLNVIVNGNANIKASSINIDSAVTNIGVGGQPIARLGDSVEVDPGSHKGTITSGGTNTSI